MDKRVEGCPRKTQTVTAAGTQLSTTLLHQGEHVGVC